MQPPAQYPQGSYPRSPYPPAANPQYPNQQSPIPQYPNPPRTTRVSIGDRGPWWVQALISAGIALAAFVIMVALDQLNTSVQPSVWVSFGIWALAFVGYAVVLAVWARGGWRHVAAPLVALAFLGLERLMTVPFYANWDWTVTSHWYFDIATWVWPIAFYSGVIFGWSVARRRTAFALIGVIPACGWIVFWAWFKQDHPTAAPHAPTWPAPPSPGPYQR